MTAYILRRLLLMIPTMIGIMGISFIVIQFAPGGPVEQVIAQPAVAPAAPVEATAPATPVALLVPATVSRPNRVPWATLLATIRATLGPGIRIRTAEAATKAR